MTSELGSVRGPSRFLPSLAAGFGAAVAMWLVGYVSHLPGLTTPPWLVGICLLACLVVAGVFVTRYSTAGVLGAAMAGAIAGVVNLLVLGSLIVGDEPNELVPLAFVWIPGSIVASMVLAGVGGLAGRSLRAAPITAEAWRSVFVTVALTATLLVVIAGGVVTSTETGLAVTDWPNSFGSNMFLYPLAKMTGGIYFEHAHRLYGALVGFTTIVLAIVLFATDRRNWLRGLAVVAVILVIGQGILGGMRVDSSLSGSVDPAVTVPELKLAIIHGVLGQIFFATISLIWAFTLPAWRTATETRADSASGERSLSTVLLCFVTLQLILGALYRHMYTPDEPMPWPAHAHLVMAALVAVHAYLSGLRAWAKYPGQPMLRRIGGAIMVLVSLQLLLGFGALVAVLARRGEPTPPAFEVIVATAHQANGALLFAACVQLFVWVRRVLPAPLKGVTVSA